MEFSVKEDIEGPIDQVFAKTTDFEAIERSAMRRGVQVKRNGSASEPAPGTSWDTTFRFRGKERDATITLTEYTPPHRVVCESRSGGLNVTTVMEFVALSRTRTRISMDMQLKPQTLSARLLVQSLKLARGSLEKRMKQRSTQFARELETRIKRGA